MDSYYFSVREYNYEGARNAEQETKPFRFSLIGQNITW